MKKYNVIISLTLVIIGILVGYLFSNYQSGYLKIKNSSGTVLKDVEINYTNNKTSIKIASLETNQKYKFKIVADDDDNISISYNDNGTRKTIFEIYVFKGIDNQYLNIISEDGVIKIKK